MFPVVTCIAFFAALPLPDCPGKRLPRNGQKLIVLVSVHFIGSAMRQELMEPSG